MPRLARRVPPPRRQLHLRQRRPRAGVREYPEVEELEGRGYLVVSHREGGYLFRERPGLIPMEDHRR